MEKIIKRNFEYYKNHVLGKYYVFTTNKNESIIVKTSPENLAHLLGIKYATQNGLFRYSGTRFFREMQVYKNGVPPFVGIYDLIDAEKDKKDILSQEELWCKNKNKIFIELFENLNQGFHNVKIYRNINKRDFKANYLQIKILDDEYYGYIGIYGDDSDDYFKFNSVIFDDGEKNDSCNYIEIKKFEIIHEKDFDASKYKFMPSPQNKNKKSIMHNSKKDLFILNNTSVNKINRKISPWKLHKGNLNKNNWQLRKNGRILIKEFEKIKKWSSQEEIVSYIKVGISD